MPQASSIKHERQEMAVADLIPYAQNPRTHGKRQIRKLARVIDEVGFTTPILVDESHVIIAGHGRLEAAKLLGLKEVPVIVSSGLSDNQKRALRIADNRLGEDSRWSLELLSLELAAIVGFEFDATLTGFDAIELDRFLTPPLPSKDLDGPLPPPPAVPVSRSGDVWRLGAHRVIIGDSRDPETYRKLLLGSVADMIIADAPYNVPIRGHVSGKGRAQHDEFRMASGEMSTEAFRSFLVQVFTLARDSSREGSLHYLFADWRMIALLLAVGDDLFDLLMNIAIWAKPNGGMGSPYRSQHEMIAIFKHGDAPHINNVQLGRMGRYRSNLWQYPGASGFSRTRKQDLEDHPTVKPVPLLADAIRDATQPGDLVLDPFGGSGSTLIAAEVTGRRAALIEIEPKFADVTLRRFQDHTGQEPIHEASGKPLSVIRSERAVDLEKETA